MSYAQFERECSITPKKNEQREYRPMPHPVTKEAKRDDNLHTVVEQQATFNQLDLQKLLFIDRVGKLRLPSSWIFLEVFFTCNN